MKTAVVRTLLALAVAAMGVVDLLSALLSRLPERLRAIRQILPTEMLDTSRTFTVRIPLKPPADQRDSHEVLDPETEFGKLAGKPTRRAA